MKKKTKFTKYRFRILEKKCVEQYADISTLKSKNNDLDKEVYSLRGTVCFQQKAIEDLENAVASWRTKYSKTAEGYVDLSNSMAAAIEEQNTLLRKMIRK